MERCPRWESNPHGPYGPTDFKSVASAVPPRGPSNSHVSLAPAAPIASDFALALARYVRSRRITRRIDRTSLGCRSRAARNETLSGNDPSPIFGVPIRCDRYTPEWPLIKYETKHATAR